MKRAFDVVAAALGLVLLGPLFLVIAMAIALEDGGPVFFRQQRVGRGGELFRVWKFRTMRVDAERGGGQLTVGQDRRITRVGRWLRSAKVDELPQLVNVLRGEMSLVGPRPEVPRYVALYSPAQRAVLDELPGITDPASLRYYDESVVLANAADPEGLYVSHVMPEKIRLNLEYAARATPLTDLFIVMSTLRRIVARSHDEQNGPLVDTTLRS
ncbi:MAG TPA: sugar transferase [Gemmatimonadaceae bacterium]|nr:sugar transferase [Gemmatimonadaceae bacterium]